MNPLLTYVLSGCVLMLLLVFAISFLFRGFFFKYLKVKASFGKLVLVKMRSTLRDYFAVGKVEEGMLIFKFNEDVKSIPVDMKTNPFYRCLGVSWVDLEEETNAICKTDYSGVPGWDPIKINNLLVRALTRPTVNSGKENLMIILVGLAIIGIIVVIVLSVKNGNALQGIASSMSNFISSAKGTILAQQTI